MYGPINIRSACSVAVNCFTNIYKCKTMFWLKNKTKNVPDCGFISINFSFKTSRKRILQWSFNANKRQSFTKKKIYFRDIITVSISLLLHWGTSGMSFETAGCHSPHNAVSRPKGHDVSKLLCFKRLTTSWHLIQRTEMLSVRETNCSNAYYWMLSGRHAHHCWKY